MNSSFTSITEKSKKLFTAAYRLHGSDRKKAEVLASEALKEFPVLHSKEKEKAADRKSRFLRNKRKKEFTDIRELSPTLAHSLFLCFSDLSRIEEMKDEKEWMRGKTTIDRQTFRYRYDKELCYRGMSGLSFDAIVAMAMIKHSFPQAETQKIYEFLKQFDYQSSTLGIQGYKPNNKFYEKRGEIERALKERFNHIDAFHLTEDKKRIETATPPKEEIEPIYSFWDLMACFAGQPAIAKKFSPKDKIPELIDNKHDFDELNEREISRVATAMNSNSFSKIIESFEYTTMKEKTQTPLMNEERFHQNGNNGQNPSSAADPTPDELQRIIDDCFEAMKFRKQLKRPVLHVVVDGHDLGHFFTARNLSKAFRLPASATYLQIKAQVNDKKETVSSLSIEQTSLSEGKRWESEITLEGDQKIALMLNPQIKDGELIASELIVGYDEQPEAAIDTLVTQFKKSFVQKLHVWHSVVSDVAFALIVTALLIAPLVSLRILSVMALSFIGATLSLILAAFLLIEEKFFAKLNIRKREYLVFQGFAVLALCLILLLRGPVFLNFNNSQSHDRMVTSKNNNQVALLVDNSNSAPPKKPRLYKDKPKPLISSSNQNIINDTNKAKTKAIDTGLKQHSSELPYDDTSIHNEKPYQVTIYIKQDVIDVLTLGDSPLSLSGLAYKTQSGENKASQNGSTNIGEIGSVPSQKPVSETAAATIDVPQSSGPNKSDPKAGIKDIQPSFSFDFSIQLHDLKVGDDVKARFSPTYINEFDQKQMGASCIALGVVKEIICDEHSIKVHIYITKIQMPDGSVLNKTLNIYLADEHRPPSE